MKLLLDENLPRKLKSLLPEHDVYTVSEMKWAGKKNGELLSLMIEGNFEALITGDKNLQHQQNFSTYPIPVILINTKFITYPDLLPIIPTLISTLEVPLPSGPTIISG